MIGLTKSKLKLKQDFRVYDEYKKCICDLIRNEAVQSMNKYTQHSDINCFEHSLNVSYISYLICRYLGFDYKSAARGGLLHDFFLYDWHNTKPENGLHGLVHPRIALNNAMERFTLNEIEMDIIEKHMWPLTIKLPKYKETYVVLLADKYCSIMEITKFHNPPVLGQLSGDQKYYMLVAKRERVNMATYNEDFKDKLVKLMLPPENKSIKELVDEYHAHEQTLYKCRKKAKAKGTVYQDNAGSKQKYSKEMQLQIIIETSPLNNHELSEYCRRKDIYAEEIEAWKQAFITGETDEESKVKKELKDSQAELKLTKKELDRKEKALAEAAALLVLKKKMQAIWSSDEED